MELMITGLCLFFIPHLVPSVVPLRLSLVNKLGDKIYQALYALLSLTGIVLIVIGFNRIEFIAIWQPPAWDRHVVYLLMLLSFYLLAAAHTKSNLKRFTRHPMLLGVLLWALAHLIANGDLKSVLLFGSFALYSIIAIISANLRGAKKQKDRYPVIQDIKTIIAGLIVYALFVFVVHPYVFKVPLF